MNHRLEFRDWVSCLRCRGGARIWRLAPTWRGARRTWCIDNEVAGATSTTVKGWVSIMGRSFEKHFQIHSIDNSWNYRAYRDINIMICIKQLKNFEEGGAQAKMPSFFVLRGGVSNNDGPWRRGGRGVKIGDFHMTSFVNGP